MILNERNRELHGSSIYNFGTKIGVGRVGVDEVTLRRGEEGGGANNKASYIAVFLL